MHLGSLIWRKRICEFWNHKSFPCVNGDWFYPDFTIKFLNSFCRKHPNKLNLPVWARPSNFFSGFLKCQLEEHFFKLFHQHCFTNNAFFIFLRNDSSLLYWVGPAKFCAPPIGSYTANSILVMNIKIFGVLVEVKFYILLRACVMVISNLNYSLINKKVPTSAIRLFWYKSSDVTNHFNLRIQKNHPCYLFMMQTFFDIFHKSPIEKDTLFLLNCWKRSPSEQLLQTSLFFFCWRLFLMAQDLTKLFGSVQDPSSEATPFDSSEPHPSGKSTGGWWHLRL